MKSICLTIILFLLEINKKYNKKINTTDGILSTHKVFYSVASAKHIPVSFIFVQLQGEWK